MAGNVKEWCWNEAGQSKHYILGGAWDEPAYMFNEADAHSPFHRYADFGFRCVKYSSTELGSNVATEVVPSRARNYDEEKPVSDEIFRVYRSLYSYDRTALNPVIESVEESGSEWRKEKLTFAAAYGNERVIAYLFLPQNTVPPYQTIVHYPGGDSITIRSSNDLDVRRIDFIIKSGRAVLWPILKSNFERGDGLTSDVPDSSVSYRDHVIYWSKDLGRSIDYLETRSEIDANKIGY